MGDTPNSYKDTFWKDLATGTETKLGLPKGILAALVTHGERSNNNQVSEAGARTPFQIIPATRDAAIKKWGIDPYLSPENAAEVAGLLFKDSLDRNKGSVPLAVAEYHGGTDRANWGPKTQAYVKRVTGAFPDIPVIEQQAPASVGTGESTFDKVFKQQQPQASNQIAAVYQAYKSGQMTPEEAQQFEADVNSGAMMLPRGASLNNAPKVEQANPQTSGAAMVLPQAVANAYASGQMTRQEMIDLERDISNGLVKMPEGIKLQKTEPLGVFGQVKEAITGNERQTQTTNSLPDWATMPELNDLSIAGAKTGLGTLLSNPAETAQIIKANYPNAQIRQDEKGNYVIRSSMDGKEYAIKPGFQVSDIPRALGALAAFTPAGRAETILGGAVKAGATQAAIEGTQAATGGNFDTKDVALAAATAGIVPPVMVGVKTVAQTVARPVQQAVKTVMGKVAPEVPGGAATAVPQAAEGVAAPVAAARPVAPEMPPVAPTVAKAAAPVEQMGASELAQTAKTAAGGGLGSKKAIQVLAEQAAPDAKTVEAARRLGIEDYLQPDHVTTNQAYRELAQAVKSIPGSEARSAELQGLSQVAKRADDLITEIGGSHDLAQVSSGVKQSLQATAAELEAQANKLYKQLREGIPAQAEAPAPTVLKFIEQRAEDLGGRQNLSSVERMIQSKLSPKQLTNEAGEVIGSKKPTYALLDDVRRDLTAARIKAQGPFKDADSGLIKKLEAELKTDQRAVVDRFGMSNTFDTAQKAVAVRKGLENDLVSLFGKNLDGSIVGNLNNGVRVLVTGDTSRFIKLIQTIPENMRQETVASGLAAAFGKTAKQGNLNFNSYAKWYEGLLKNKQAYTAVMSNLPTVARRQLSDLYRVSKSVSMATKERITTGRIQAVTEELKGGEGLLSRVYGAAKRNALGATIGTGAGSVMGPGVGAAVASALSRGAKPNALKAADALISSLEFQQAVKQAATGESKQAATRLAYSKPFTKFVRAIGNPKEMSNRERWILQALEANNQTKSNEQ